MTDALRDAEALARRNVLRVITPLGGVEPTLAAFDAYRDAIAKRVREERDADVRALVEAARGAIHGECCGSIVDGTHAAPDCPVAILRSALQPFEGEAPSRDEALREALGQLLAAERLMEDTAQLDGEVREEVERTWAQAVSVARAIYSLEAAPASPEVG